MNLGRTVSRLQKARRSSEELARLVATHGDHDSIVDVLEDCLSDLRSIPEILEAEMKQWARMRPRADPVRAEVEAFCSDVKASVDKAPKDDLLRWIKVARDGVLHGGGVVPMTWKTQVEHLSTEDLEPGPSGASLVLGPGMYWVVNQGTTDEYRVPARPRAGTRSAGGLRHGVALAAPPFKVRGQMLPISVWMLGDPVATVHAGLEYWQDQTREVASRWK